VAGDGAPSLDPVIQKPTGGPRPRRLIARGCNLYVAESNRVEVFRIHAGGALQLVGATKSTPDMRAHDIELSPDGRTLYVPLRRQAAIASYPLDEDGKPNTDVVTENDVPAGRPTSCVYGPNIADWEDIEVGNGKLYAAWTNKLMVYGIAETGQLIGAALVPRDNNGDGEIGADETACPTYTNTPADTITACIDPDVRPRPTRPDPSCTFSFRGHMAGAVGLVVNGTTLVTSLRFTHQLLGFTLDGTGNFAAFGADPADPTKKEKKKERKSRKKNRTDEIIRYIGLTILTPSDDAPIVYAAGYSGRTDAFRLHANDEGQLILPKQPTTETFKDVTSTPVRTALGSTAQGRPVLYVASGELDRVQAFRLFPGGAIDQNASPMETNIQKDSFPNDVVPVDITSCD
jgi:6-phosphogluconolactonase (cycloisomerase 2 family)